MKKIKAQRYSSMLKGQIRYWLEKIKREMAERIAEGLEEAIIFGKENKCI